MTSLDNRDTRSLLLKLGVGTLILAAGCSAEAGDYGSVEEIDTISSDLANGVGGDPYDGWTPLSDRSGDPASAVDDPGICFSESGFVIFQRVSSNKFKSVTWDSSGLPAAGVFNPRLSEWSTWGTSSKTFKSKPACANLDAIDSDEDRTFEIVLAGTASNDKIYTSAAQANDSADGSEPNVPTGVTDWTVVSALRTFAGGPGIAVGAGKVVVVGRGLSDSLIYAYTRSLPYEDGSWSHSVQAPALPSGWTAQGSPAIAYTLANINKFTVMVRATKTGAPATFYRAYFDGASWGASWARALTCCSGDPALEFSSDVDALTVFGLSPMRGGADVVQATGLNVTYGTLRTVRGYELATVIGTPAALGLWEPFEGERRHTVVARKSDGTLAFTGTNGPISP